MSITITHNLLFIYVDSKEIINECLLTCVRASLAPDFDRDLEQTYVYYVQYYICFDV